MSSASPAHTRTVLVIEDEAAVLAFVRTALERGGYEVVSSNSGADALKVLETETFCGIISDMRTPGGVDGADVHTWLKQHRPEMASRMVVITGDIVNEETATALRKTGVPYVEKPFRISQLMDVVKRLFGDPQ